MKTVIRTKLTGNHVEIRSHELGYALKVIYCPTKEYSTCSHVGEDFMILSPAKQKKGKVINTQRSKFPPYSYYKMYSFLWKPTGKVQEVKKYNFEGDTATPL